MSMLDTYDNSDGSLDGAVEKIMAKLGTDEGKPTEASGKMEKQNGTRAEDLQVETDPVIEPEEGDEDRPEASDGEDPADKNTADDDELFLEIPSEEEGKEAEKIRAADALEAYKSQRQMKESIASAINKQEAEYIAKNDAMLEQIKAVQTEVQRRAEAALKMIPRPQRPNPVLLDQNSQYYDPARYAAMELDYQDQVAALSHYDKTAKEARDTQEKIEQVQSAQTAEREYARLARHKGFEAYADPAKRGALETALVERLSKSPLAITAEDLKGVQSHKLWLLAENYLKMTETAAKAPEVRKQVQEKAVKITKGQRAGQDRAPNGQFVNDARKELKETGTQDAFANYLIKSGALRGI